MEERIYTISLREAFSHSRAKKAERAVKEIKEYLKKHTKKEKVSISNAISQAVYARGYKKCPRKVKVIVRIEEDSAKAYLFGEEPKKEEPKKEKKEEKPEGKEEPKKEEPKKEEPKEGAKSKAENKQAKSST
ncbi:MAG: 50S ribosomal protein L31e [Candidatus Anstonellales archaeon]